MLWKIDVISGLGLTSQGGDSVLYHKVSIQPALLIVTALPFNTFKLLLTDLKY